MIHRRTIGALVASYLAVMSCIVYLFTSPVSTVPPGGGVVTRTPHVPTDKELESISTLMSNVSRGEYPGTEKTRPGIRGPIPVWSQRTAILYYNRRLVGVPIKWLSLAMGVVGNSRNIISNKKLLRSAWKRANPSKFSEVEPYLPRTWSDIDSFETDMDEGTTYVYKPVLGSGGDGILFKKGIEMSTKIRDKEERGDRSGWVVQELIDPYLFNNKKTHMRCITLVILQPDGSREFFIYNKMRIFTAAEEFDESRLTGAGDNSFMLLTNMHQNKIHFERDPANAGKKFDPSACISDAETSMADSTGPLSFDLVFSSAKKMHSIIYSIIGDVIECVPTDISIYGDSCFHMMASDIAMDREGRLYFLEMNNAMGYKAWTSEEISGFSNGVAALVKGTASPYVAKDSSMWYKM